MGGGGTGEGCAGPCTGTPTHATRRSRGRERAPHRTPAAGVRGSPGLGAGASWPRTAEQVDGTRRDRAHRPRAARANDTGASASARSSTRSRRPVPVPWLDGKRVLARRPDRRPDGTAVLGVAPRSLRLGAVRGRFRFSCSEPTLSTSTGTTDHAFYYYHLCICSSLPDDRGFVRHRLQGCKRARPRPVAPPKRPSYAHLHHSPAVRCGERVASPHRSLICVMILACLRDLRHSTRGCTRRSVC